MPPVARMSLELLRDIASQRMGAPKAQVEQDLERIEALAPDIVPQERYPADWVVFRILGEQRSMARPELLTGADLLVDLSALAERLSAQARFHVTEEMVGLAALCERWDVHVKTIDRYRRQGLIARRLLGADGKPRVCFSPAAVARFETVRAKELSRAASFERIDEALRERMVRWAAGYRRRLGWTLNRSAGRIAERTQRSREAVRRVLKVSSATQYSEPEPLSSLEQKVIYRVMRRGGEPAVLGRLYRKPLGSIQRAWGVARAEQLRGLIIEAPALADATLEDAVLLSPPAHSGLALAPKLDVVEFLASARATGVTIGVEETVRIAAYRHLLGLARGRIAVFSRHFPRSSDIDATYTALRWACRLRAMLVQSQFRQMLQNLEASIGTELATIRSSVLRALLSEAIRMVSEAVESHALASGTKRGRLAAPVGLAINRLAAHWLKEHGTDLAGKGGVRAASRLLPGLHLPDWTLDLCAWQRKIEPDPRLRRALGRLEPMQREVLVRRFGWGDSAPRTLVQCEAIFGVSSIKIARLERAALRAAHLAVCGGGTS